MARLIIPEKLVLADNVQTKMTGNAAFPTPNPTLPALQTARDELATAHMAVVATESTLAEQRLIEAQKEAALDLVLTQLADYCQSVCNDDPAILESSGFPLAQVPTSVGPLPAPINLRSVAGEMPGTSLLSWKRDYGTKSFLAECSTSPNGPWTQFYAGSKARCVATGLTSGTVYYFRVRAIGAAGLSPWSDISEKRAP